jgi:hypothetical protein
MFWRYRPHGLLAIPRLLRKGVHREKVREALRIETTNAKQHCRELEALLDELVPTVEGLIQLLEQWVGDYARGKTTQSTASRNLAVFKRVRRRDLHPITKRLVAIIKEL